MEVKNSVRQIARYCAVVRRLGGRIFGDCAVRIARGGVHFIVIGELRGVSALTFWE